jgi:acyl carrier protein
VAKDLLNEITLLVSAQLGIPLPPPEGRIVVDLGAESADIVNIVAALEDRYRIQIEEEMIQELRTVNDLFDLVRDLLGAER